MREHKVDNYIGGAQIEQGDRPRLAALAPEQPTQPVFFTFLLFTEAKTLSSSTNSLPSAGNRLLIL
jgi:hypothetical protein